MIRLEITNSARDTVFRNNCMYIDKTALIYQLTHTDKVDLENNQEKYYQTEVDHRKVVKVGVNFDSLTRTLGEWKIEYS